MTEATATSGGIKSFIKKSLIGGIVVLLPLTLVIAFFRWLFGFITGLIQPITDQLIILYTVPDYLGHIIVIAIIVLLCFTVGNIVTTRIGQWVWDQAEAFLAKKVPGYRAVKDLVSQLMGHGNGALRGEVCLVRISGAQVNIAVAGMITAKHADGSFTVFAPCGPNPTTGFIYHVGPELVELRPDVKVETLMKTVIACGVGAGEVLKKR